MTKELNDPAWWKQIGVTVGVKIDLWCGGRRWSVVVIAARKKMIKIVTIIEPRCTLPQCFHLFTKFQNPHNHP